MNDRQLLRYSRQILLQDFDVAGQERLLAARVLLVGLGGLGSPAALYLAAAGVGELWLADFDQVELSNLQRQIAHGEADLGRDKVASAAEAVAAINRETRLHALNRRLEGAELDQVVEQVDLVMDCSDRFSTRFEVNRSCFQVGRPLVSGAAIRAEGQVTVFDPRRPDSPCYHCLYGGMDPAAGLSCSESGVLAPVVGVVGSMQAIEAMKLIGGYGEPLVGRLWLLDAAAGETRQFKLSADPACPVCSERGG